MVDALKSVSTRKTTATSTPQSKKAVKGQKKNAAGGFTFVVSDMDRAKRFLILGTEGNFYTPGETLAAENAKTLIKLASDSSTATELVDSIVEVSVAGRAPKVNPALFALAVAASHGTDVNKRYALSKLSEVARTGTHLFLFAGYVEQFRGWGPALRKAVANWYLDKPIDKLAYQAVKYQNREGFTHRDMFRLSHPETSNPDLQGLGEWILRSDHSKAPRIVEGYVLAQKADLETLPALIRAYGLSWEMLPTSALKDVDVWNALLDGNVPLGALIRQLPRLTRLGVVGKMGAGRTAEVVARLTDKAEIERARIHPIQLLLAHKTYGSGRSEKGDSTWTPVREVVDALDKAFYLAFKNVVPAGKRTLIGLDVSGSMGSPIFNSPLTSREATAAIALVTVATEPSTHVIGFTGGSGGYSWGGSRKATTPAGKGSFGSTVVNLDSEVSASRRLDDVISSISGLPFGNTDCALPMLYALEEGLEVDTFIIMTDNDTWVGRVHPFEALKQYRAKTGIDARLIVLSTSSSRASIASPEDAGMLDIAGFDSAAPALVADFSRGL